MPKYDLIESLIRNKDDILLKLNNTKNSDIVRLRNEAAENGIEMTIEEVISHLNLLKEIVSE